MFLIAFITISVGLYSFQQLKWEAPRTVVVPKGWPEPVYQGRVSPEGFELGKKLFYDPNISRDGSVSCAHCHLSFTGFTHVDHNVSHGIEDRIGTRNSPALINLAWNKTFHWDGGVNHLEVQMINPIQHPAEMDNSLENVIDYLNSDKKYQGMFFSAFGDSTVSTKHMLQAFTEFTASLISANSKFDQASKKKSSVKFTKQEKKGYKIFKKHCNECHTAPLFNSNIYASNGLPIDTSFNDVGRYGITNIGSDSLQFRVPTLRNIQYTFPYMHDGRFKNLSAVIDHYTNEIDISNPYLSKPLRKKIILSDEQKKDLIAFLYMLTDKEFLYNKDFRPSR